MEGHSVAVYSVESVRVLDLSASGVLLQSREHVADLAIIVVSAEDLVDLSISGVVGEVMVELFERRRIGPGRGPR